jgi:hypothetical protein
MDQNGDASGFWRATFISILLIVAAIFALLISMAIANEHGIIQQIIRDIGIALIVAAVIIFTIEQKSRDELNKMVSRFLQRTHENLFQTILGVEFPKPMFDFVRDRLMKEPVFRTEAEVHYTILPISETVGPRWNISTILLDYSFSYKIKNLSDRDQTHPIRFFVEEPLDHSAKTDKQFPYLEIDGVEIAHSDIRHADKEWKDRPGLRRFEHHLRMAPKEESFIRLRHRMTKLIVDTECWRTLHPADSLRFSITHPVELSVGVDAMHPDELTTIQDNESSFVGMISRPLFPANGFLFWWHPRATPKKAEPELTPASEAIETT